MARVFTSLLIVTGLQTWAQLELPEGLPEPETPPEIEVEVDEEEVRELTRQIQSRTEITERRAPEAEHPGRERFERVARRIRSAPARVPMRIDLSSGESVGGVVENHFLDLVTTAGRFPILWSEVVILERRDREVRVSLSDGDAVSGSLQAEPLVLEQDDMSIRVVQPAEVVRLRVLRERSHGP